MNLARFFREQQERLSQKLGIPLPRFSIWDPQIPDARVRDPKKQGLINGGELGMMTRIYCIDCHRPSPYATTGQLEKVMYKCLRCLKLNGAPVGAGPLVPGTERL